jgi:hypothetical protein
MLRLQWTRHPEFPGPPGPDALHPFCRPRQLGRRGRRGAEGPRSHQHRTRPRLLGIQLRLCPVSAGRGLVRGSLRRAAHSERLRTGLVDNDHKQQRFGTIAAAMQACRRRSSRGGSDFDNNISRAIIRSEAFGAARKSGSHLTLRWREQDSKPRSPGYGEPGASRRARRDPRRQREARDGERGVRC